MDTKAVAIQAAALVMFACVLSPAQLRVRARFAVTQAAAEKAVAEGLFHEETVHPGVDVRLLTDVVASLPSASLEVIGVGPAHVESLASSHAVHVLVRLGCHVRSACVPFYASVTLPDTVTLPAGAVPAAAAGMFGKTAFNSKTSPNRLRAQATLVLHRGEHVTLVLDDGAVRIEVPVISLADAAAGDEVRAASLDHKRVYAAQAISSTELKGEF